MTTTDPFLDEGAVDATGPSSFAVFAGDTGRVPLPVRLTIAALLKQPYIAATGAHADAFRVLIEHRDVIVSRFHELFFDVVIDEERGVAFKKKVVAETGSPFPSLAKDQRFSREETILLVLLRRRHHSERSAGNDRVYVDRETLLEHASAFRDPTVTNEAAAIGAVEKAIESLVKQRLLGKTADADRFEILPVIEVLLPVETLRGLAEWIAGNIDERTSPATEPDDGLEDVDEIEVRT